MKLSLPWENDQNKLVDGESYLVQMKHGIIQGRWSEQDQYFTGYYFQDISFNGHSWIPMEEIE